MNYTFKSVICIICLCITHAGQAQYFPDTSWSRCYGGSSYDAGVDVQQTSDGGYIVLGISNSTDADLISAPPGYKQWILKLDSSGNILWQKYYDLLIDNQPATIRQTDDQGIIFGGEFLTKLDANGNSSWQMPFAGQYVIQTADGGYAILHNWNELGQYYCLLTKLSPAGTPEWTHMTSSVQANSLVQCADSGYLIAGFYYVWGPGFNFSYYEKIDQAGVTELNKTQGFGVLSKGISSADSFIFAGVENEWNEPPHQVLRKKTDTSTVWETQTQDVTFLDIIESRDSTYLVAGNSDSANAALWKFNQAGELILLREFGGSNTDAFAKVILTRDGGYMALGRTNSQDGMANGNHGEFDLWLVKFNKDTSIHPTVIRAPLPINNIAKTKAYPIPCTGRLNIELSDGSIPQRFTLMTIEGKEVSAPSHCSGNKCTLHLENFPAGNYILQIASDQALEYLHVILNHK